MVTFNFEIDFDLQFEEAKYIRWIKDIISGEERMIGDVNYIFCDDAFLHDINVRFLNHDTFTDIISFDYSEGITISGDIFISVERVNENASKYEVSFHDELLRVMAHGLLHYCGYGDKNEVEQVIMRKKEDEKISLFHVEQ